MHFHVGQLLLSAACISGGLSGVALQLYHVVTLFEAFDGTLGRAQLLTEFLDTGVDELLGAKSHQVFVFIRLTVVADDELLEVVDGTLGTLIFFNKVEHGGVVLPRYG